MDNIGQAAALDVEAAQMGQLPQVGAACLHAPGNCGQIGGFGEVPWSSMINLDAMIPWAMEQ